jgi:hypothetical protein
MRLDRSSGTRCDESTGPPTTRGRVSPDACLDCLSRASERRSLWDGILLQYRDVSQRWRRRRARSSRWSRSEGPTGATMATTRPENGIDTVDPARELRGAPASERSRPARTAPDTGGSRPRRRSDVRAAADEPRAGDPQPHLVQLRRRGRRPAGQRRPRRRAARRRDGQPLRHNPPDAVAVSQPG